MKSFAVELRRESYITVNVEADSKEEAEEKAWHEIEHNYPNINDSNWELSNIEEKNLPKPASPCTHHCEANAYKKDIANLKHEVENLTRALKEARK